jgi:hypothetical protein
MILMGLSTVMIRSAAPIRSGMTNQGQTLHWLLLLLRRRLSSLLQSSLLQSSLLQSLRHLSRLLLLTRAQMLSIILLSRT